jgi:hypothetical protein
VEAFLLAAASSSPHYVLTKTTAKCFQVDVPRRTTIFVDYSAPDLVTELDLESNLEKIDERRRAKIESIKKGVGTRLEENFLLALVGCVLTNPFSPLGKTYERHKPSRPAERKDGHIRVTWVGREKG